MKYPNFREEKKLWLKGYKGVVCLDEAGRGCLAGPVIAAAVILKNLKSEIRNLKQILKIRDSKKLTIKKRENFYKILTKQPQVEWAIGRVSEKVIDKINILEATKLAMKRALKNLEKKLKKQKIPKINDREKFLAIDFLILDGNFKLDVPIPQKSVVKADEKVFSCACASILAKVTRDRIIQRYHKKYPQYGFAKNKGYPTKFHLKMLKKYGPSVIHRLTFTPVKKMIQ